MKAIRFFVDDGDTQRQLQENATRLDALDHRFDLFMRELADIHELIGREAIKDQQYRALVDRRVLAISEAIAYLVQILKPSANLPAIRARLIHGPITKQLKGV